MIERAKKFLEMVVREWMGEDSPPPLMTIACAEGGRRGEDRWTKGGRERRGLKVHFRHKPTAGGVGGSRGKRSGGMRTVFPHTLIKISFYLCRKSLRVSK